MTDDNPYSAPHAELRPEPTAQPYALAAYPRTASMGRGWSWIKEGYSDYFRRSWAAWIGAILLGMVAFVVLSLIPFVNYLFQLLTPFIWYAGLALGCRAQAQAQPFRVSHLWAGFGKRVGSLVLLSLGYNVAFIAIVALAVALIYPEIFTLETDALLGPSPQLSARQALLAVLVALALTLPIVMATFFAPHLIVLNDQSLLSSVRLSFIGCARNVLPFLVWGIGILALFTLFMLVITAVSLGSPLAVFGFPLALLLLLPVMTASIYIAYEDIFLQG